MASTHESVAEALRTTLASITAGGGYVYTPDAVKRVVFFPDEVDLDASLTTIYLIRPGQETRKITNQGCYVDCEFEFLVVVARRFTEPTENPHTSGPVRWQVTADMVADVLAKIHADTNLGMASATAGVVDVYGVQTDYERYLPSWALAEIRFIVRYRYDRAGGR